MNEVQNRLVVLYQQMYEHTRPECGTACGQTKTCCDPSYCRMAEKYALSSWGVDLSSRRTSHPQAPFLGSNGCVVEPHLRPLCTVHTCEINSMGFKEGDAAWTDKYFEIREQIEDAEETRMTQTHPPR